MSNPSARPNPHRPPLDEARVGIRTKLSALWIAVMFLYVYVDIFNFFKPGTIDDILIGRVWTLDITSAFALGGLILMTVPSLMIALTVMLPAAAARWTNVVVAALYVAPSVFNVVDETWSFYYVGAATETALLVLVVRYAWTWPRPMARTAEAANARATPDPVNVGLPRPSSV